MEKDYRKKPDKEKEPFTYSVWRSRGMLGMSPEERVLMDTLAQMNATHKFLFRDEKGKPIGDWWSIKDMRKFVKVIVPEIRKYFTLVQLEKHEKRIKKLEKK